jgi:hypothetical protein
MTLRLQASYNDDLEGVAAICAVPFNRYLRGNPPDRSNADIAQLAADFVRRTNLPFFGQFEHANLLRQQGLAAQSYPTEGGGEWVQTHVLLKWVADEVRALGKGSTVILLVLRHHSYRAAALARYYGLDPRVPAACKKIRYDIRIRPGFQWWCTSPITYVPWEYTVARGGLAVIELSGKL